MMYTALHPDKVQNLITLATPTRFDIDIQLAVWEGEGENIFCIHGLSANCRCWDRIVSGIEREFRVLAMDLRGRGLSDKPPTGYSIARG